MDKAMMLNMLQNYYGLNKDIDFASLLGISSQVLSNWKKRNTFDAELIYTKCLNINSEWLLTGQGSMFKNTHSDGYKTIYWRDDETGENVATDINESRYIHTEKQLDPPDTGHYKELAAARLEIIEGLKFKVATLEKELATLKQAPKDPILYKNVAEPEPELITEKHK